MRLLALLAVLCCAFPASGQPFDEEGGAPPPPSDFAIAINHGRIHLIVPAGEPKSIRIPLIETRGSEEGFGSFVEIEESPSGFKIRADWDELGTPYWFRMELEQPAGGFAISLYAHATDNSYGSRETFASYGALHESTDTPPRLLRALLNRAGAPVIDFDLLRESPPTPTPGLLQACREQIGRLDADDWATRQDATERLHAKPMRDAVAVVAEGMALSPEARFRLADLIDRPVIEVPASLVAGLMGMEE